MKEYTISCGKGEVHLAIYLHEGRPALLTGIVLTALILTAAFAAFVPIVWGVETHWSMPATLSAALAITGSFLVIWGFVQIYGQVLFETGVEQQHLVKEPW